MRVVRVREAAQARVVLSLCGPRKSALFGRAGRVRSRRLDTRRRHRHPSRRGARARPSTAARRRRRRPPHGRRTGRLRAMDRRPARRLPRAPRARRRARPVLAAVSGCGARQGRAGDECPRLGFERLEFDPELAVVALAVGRVMDAPVTRRAQRDHMVVIVRAAVREAPCVVWLEVRMPAPCEERCGLTAPLA
jgi:hypothetical protein